MFMPNIFFPTREGLPIAEVKQQDPNSDSAKAGVLFEVTIPPNAVPGERFFFWVMNKKINIGYPPNVRPFQKFSFILPFNIVEKCSANPIVPPYNMVAQGNGYPSTGAANNVVMGNNRDQIEENINLDDLEGFEDLSDENTFNKYHNFSIENCIPHPDPLVESSSLASVDFPVISYQPFFPIEMLAKGCLSSPQMETIIYACQKHDMFLQTGERRGFFLGDGAGVGKGRQLAGIIYENWLRGRKKHIWLSASADLMLDSRRDIEDIGASFIPSEALLKLPYGKIDFEEGIIFATYSSLVASSGRRSRLNQLIKWCGGDSFDGCIMFDECHKAKNLKYNSSQGHSSKTAQAVYTIQEKCPLARIVYCSATGISEPSDMAYMYRLGLWGPGTSFVNGFDGFREAIERDGVGMMELVAMHMKRNGSYICRTLSFEGCSFQIVEDSLSKDQLAKYDQAAVLWQEIFFELIKCLDNKTLGFDWNGNQENSDSDNDSVSSCMDENDEKPLSISGKSVNAAVLRYFWGVHQRFFRDLCISFKVPCTVRIVKDALSEGKCAVIGLQSTGGSAIESGAGRPSSTSRDGDTASDTISAPKLSLKRIIKKVFPLPAKPDSIIFAEMAELQEKRENRARERCLEIELRTGQRSRRSAVNYREDASDDEFYCSSSDNDDSDSDCSEDSNSNKKNGSWKKRLVKLKVKKPTEPASYAALVAAPNIVKASSAFQYFQKKMTPIVKEEAKNSSNIDSQSKFFSFIVSRISSLWKSLSDADRHEYLVLAENDKVRYLREKQKLDEEALAQQELRRLKNDPTILLRDDLKPLANISASSSNGTKLSKDIIDITGSDDSHSDSSDMDDENSNQDDSSEDYCHVCGFDGDLLCCDHCPLVFHIECLVPSLDCVPEGDWSCPYCILAGKGEGNKISAKSAIDKFTEKILGKNRDLKKSRNFDDLNGPSNNNTDDSSKKRKILIENDIVDNHQGSIEHKIEPNTTRKIIEDPEDSDYSKSENSRGSNYEIEQKKIEETYNRILNMRDGFLSRVEDLDLPGNPLDLLIDQLGGTDSVAELTGRKTRMVRTEDGMGFKFEKRNVNGVSLDKQNLYEKDEFLNGPKRVAIISEAASSGISLQADRRIVNQNRRVHITLELPWVADRAIQQLGRTHRSNQSSSPEYKLLISPIGGERRFAAAVSKRLESLGALTQGDRRATVGAQSLTLTNFNFESKYGSKALDDFFAKLSWNKDTKEFSELISEKYAQEFITEMNSSNILNAKFLSSTLRKSWPNISTSMIRLKDVVKVWLFKVGIDCSVTAKINVAKFLNRILGLEHEKQNLVFSIFLQIFEDTIRVAKQEGSYDQGITEITGDTQTEPAVLYTDTEGNNVYHSQVSLDKGISWEKSLEIFEEAKRENSLADLTKESDTKNNNNNNNNNNNSGSPPLIGYYERRNSRYLFIVLVCEKASDVIFDRFDKGKIVIYRPRVGKKIVYKYDFLKSYEAITPESAEMIWKQEYNKVSSFGRLITYELITGAVISIWNMISMVMKSEKNKKESRITRIIRAKVPLKPPQESESSDEAVAIKLESNQEDNKFLKIIGLWVPDKYIERVLASFKKLKPEPEAKIDNDTSNGESL